MMRAGTVLRPSWWTVLLVAAAAWVGCSPPAGRAQLDQPVPAFALPSLDGGTLRDTDLDRDRPVVINFWATWCGPCVREIPALSELHRSGTAQVISISLDVGGWDVIEPFVEKHAIDYPVLLGDTTLFSRFGGAAIPYTMILDADGVVRDVHTGLVSRRTLDSSIAKLLR